MSFRSRSRLVALLLAAVLVAAACGSEEDTTGDGSASASTSSSASASEPADEDLPADDEVDDTSGAEEEPAVEEESVEEVDAEADAPAESTTTTEAPAELVRPAELEGKTVVAFGSNVWPIVEDLLVVGIVPDAIVRNEGSQDAPVYIAEGFGERIAGAEMYEMNLLSPSIETFASIGGDVLAVPIEFEPFLTEELLGLFETVIFTQLDDWRASVGRVVEGSGADSALLDELEARYVARVSEVQSATALDLGSLTISTFSINGDQAVPDSLQGPGMRAALDVGLQPIAIAEDVPNRDQPALSLERIGELDADLVFYNVRSAQDLDELSANALWQQTSAHANGTVYPGVSEWRQGGFLGTLFVLDELEAALLDFESKGLG